ncbi:methyltransferase [Marinomonas algarum]|uniref:SAM-dependent methyltransferase n=1 Tax=Marinomonas algarum TaxID=2883105 RepID=A0A9X1IRK9_9GAMM|nr:methyltransferase [Marinomonas algarum]MCB5162878.1 SAM-dependent methyltransferase [Marinomonas algarum]
MTAFSLRFRALDAWLAEHIALWQFDTFAEVDNPWRAMYPALASYLEQVDFDALHSDDFYATVFRLCPSLLAWGEAAVSGQPALAALDDRSEQSVSLPGYVSTGIKGRKWSQIQAFVAQTPVVSDYVEWCAGKGHLGKVLAFQQQARVQSLEWQQVLCEAGEQEAKRLGVDQRFAHVDVLKQQGRAALFDADCVVALHACGDLHRVLLQQAAEAKTSQLCLVPCCYHLTQAAVYVPLSGEAQGSALCLRQADLKLAVKEVVTAGAREQRLKRLELTYRLGFDAWQREVRGEDGYLPVPSLQKALLGQGFVGFCDWAAEQKHFSQRITKAEAVHFERVGQARYETVQRLEAISQLFRPALEQWLVLDRAMYLQEQGYHVEIGAFCDKTLTPRNWMIRAKRD